MMSLLYFAIITSCLSMTHGRDCSWGDSNVLDKLVHNCPPLYTINSDEEYCCYDSDFNPRCCNLMEFALTYIIIAAVVIIVLSLICCIVSCFLCPCCICYKRRHPVPI